jgi:8-amino-7-oxononanoate synthase
VSLRQALAGDLAAVVQRSQFRRRRVLESPQQPHAVIDGRSVTAFCSNDYLGLAADPRIAAAAKAGIDRYGTGAGASHLINGHVTAHHELELALAAFVRMPAALLFSTGYMANLGVVTALLGRGDAVFADRLNHASLNDAAMLSRATLKRFPHNDLDALEQQLRTTKARRRLIVVDAVFSMDGDAAPVAGLLALCERYDAWLMLDDAHGFGVLGPQGRGTATQAGIRSERLIYMATLGKAAGVAGAFVAGEPELVELLIQHARTYIFTTAAPALQAHALLTSLQLIEHEEWRRSRLQDLIARLRSGLAGSTWRLLPSGTAIQPLMIGDNDAAVSLAERLAGEGLLVPAIRPPTVPQGTARLRISLSAAHRPEDVDRLVAALCAA